MFKRRYLSVVVVTLVLLAVVAVPVFATTPTGNSWVDNILLWHYGNSRTTSYDAGQYKLDVDTILRQYGQYEKGASNSKIISGLDDVTATAVRCKAGGGWTAHGSHWVWTWPGLVPVWSGTSSGS